MNFKKLLILSPLFLIYCIQFKVDTLSPDNLTRISIGNNPENINVEIVNNVLTNIPIQIPYRAGKVYIADNKNASIKAFDSQGNLDSVIGRTDLEFPSNTSLYSYKFGNIGHISIDSDDNLYIQNRFGKKEDLTLIPKEEDIYKKYSGTFDPSPTAPLPSYIIKMDRKGVAEAILGANGKNTEPFRYIEFMLATQDDYLFVYHKMAEEMRLTFIKGNNLAGEIRESQLNIYQKDEFKDLQIILDRMVPHPDGNYALVSFSFYNKSDKRFKFRKIFRVAFEKPTEAIAIKEIQDPSELLFSVLENEEFYIWETEDGGNSIRLQVHSSEGNHINNKRLPIDPPRGQWREIYSDGQENILSIRVRAGFVELYRWR
jgi:hypothetical protein